MCGIAGLIDPRGPSPEELAHRAQAMAESMRRRGPDHQAAWADPRGGVALGHARLSIIDLTAAAHQPMLSADGRWALVYNGEIFNFAELRRELETAGVAFRTRSDTEVLLALCEHLGVDKAVQRLVGMFAFALWDTVDRRLTLARDRLGIKPLYYGVLDGVFVFASELKPLAPHLGSAQLDPESLWLLLRYGHIGAPRSIFREVSKLPPGTILGVSLHDVGAELPRPRRYWDATEVALRGVRERPRHTEGEACEALLAQLREAVRMRLVADVPLGALLSGGVDSSLVTALMAEAVPRVRTFSVGFSEAEFDETPFALKVAQHLGTEHTDLRVSVKDALALVEDLPAMYDEPFADSSQIPTYFACKLARGQVTVALSGDGGDELFGGYDRYRQAPALWQKLAVIPLPVRRMAARARAFDPWLGPVAGTIPRAFDPGRARSRWLRMSSVLAARTEREFYRSFLATWGNPTELLHEPPGHTPEFGDPKAWSELPSGADRMMADDLSTSLPSDMLTKLDRASMGASLEARVPLLDHRVVALAWTLPARCKLRDGTGKWILRELLARYVPPPLFERHKQGFSIPLDRWLRGGLRDWAESLLSRDRLDADGIFDTEAIRSIWTDYLAHRLGAGSLLWNVLMFQCWLDRWSRDYGHRPSVATG